MYCLDTSSSILPHNTTQHPFLPRLWPSTTGRKGSWPASSSGATARRPASPTYNNNHHHQHHHRPSPPTTTPAAPRPHPRHRHRSSSCRHPRRGPAAPPQQQHHHQATTTTPPTRKHAPISPPHTSTPYMRCSPRPRTWSCSSPRSRMPRPSTTSPGAAASSRPTTPTTAPRPSWTRRRPPRRVAVGFARVWLCVWGLGGKCVSWFVGGRERPIRAPSLSLL